MKYLKKRVSRRRHKKTCQKTCRKKRRCNTVRRRNMMKGG